jgi:hypothetical protein
LRLDRQNQREKGEKRASQHNEAKAIKDLRIIVGRIAATPG